MSMETVQASRVRKGQLVVIEGVTVRVTKREKWNSRSVRVYFEDAGSGIPASRYYQAWTPASYRLLDLSTELTLGVA